MCRYLSIVKEEGLEISQPALDTDSWLHHPITKRNNTVRLHRSPVVVFSLFFLTESTFSYRNTEKTMSLNLNRRIYLIMDGGYVCDETQTGPPCSG